MKRFWHHIMTAIGFHIEFTNSYRGPDGEWINEIRCNHCSFQKPL